MSLVAQASRLCRKTREFRTGETPVPPSETESYCKTNNLSTVALPSGQDSRPQTALKSVADHPPEQHRHQPAPAAAAHCSPPASSRRRRCKAGQPALDGRLCECRRNRASWAKARSRKSTSTSHPSESPAARSCMAQNDQNEQCAACEIVGEKSRNFGVREFVRSGGREVGRSGGRSIRQQRQTTSTSQKNPTRPKTAQSAPAYWLLPTGYWLLPSGH
jgi:hypothetical protein